VFLIATMALLGAYAIYVSRRRRDAQARAALEPPPLPPFADPRLILVGLQIVQAIGFKRLLPIVAIAGAGFALASRPPSEGDAAASGPAQVRAAVAALGRRDGGVRGGIRREEFPRKGRRFRGRPASLPLDVRQPIRIDRSRWRRGRTRACAPIPNIRNVKIRTGGDGSRCRAVASLGGTALRRNSRRQKPRTRAAGLGRSRAPRHGHKPQSAQLPWRRVGRLKVSNPLAPRQLIFRTGSVEAMIRGNEPEK
jgi:hypothetical protein